MTAFRIFRDASGTIVAAMQGAFVEDVPAPIPDGFTFEVVDNATYDMARTTIAAASPLPPTRIDKADIWRRASDAEATVIDVALSAQPVRLRNLFRDAAYLSSSDEMFPTLWAGFVTAFGEARAAELLAPSG